MLAIESSSSDARFGPRQIVTEINRVARALVRAADAAPDDISEIRKLATQLASVSAEDFAADHSGSGLGFTRGYDGFVVVCAYERKGSIHG